MEDCTLPMDTLIDILARLPVKSLMLFKCVCKFFYDLIKNNHQFIDKQYEFRKGKSQCAVIDFEPAFTVPQPRPNQVFNLIYQDTESDDAECIYLHLPNSNTKFVKCCHGMLCLILCRGDLVSYDIAEIISPEIIFDVLIFNPFTREVKVLPFIKVPEKPPNKEGLQIQFGFGLSNNMTWKIIMLLSFEDSNLERGGSHHDIVMVSSQEGDVWSWRQIDAALDSLHLNLLFDTREFYFKGRYYWQSFKGHLVWFDMDDEVFGKIELPSNVEVLDYTVMNESIALFTFPQPCTENEVCTEIWIMDENNNNINWHKQASFFSSKDILENEYFDPIGFWNPSGDLLEFSGHMEMRYTNYNYPLVEEFYFKEGFEPNLISIDFETHEKKTIFTSQERKSTLTIGFNPAGHVEVCSERSVNKIQEWNDRNIVWDKGIYFRTFHESLKLL